MINFNIIYDWWYFFNIINIEISINIIYDWDLFQCQLWLSLVLILMSRLALSIDILWGLIEARLTRFCIIISERVIYTQNCEWSLYYSNRLGRMPNHIWQYRTTTACTVWLVLRIMQVRMTVEKYCFQEMLSHGSDIASLLK